MCYVCKVQVRDYRHFGDERQPEKCPLWEDAETRHHREQAAARAALGDAAPPDVGPPARPPRAGALPVVAHAVRLAFPRMPPGADAANARWNRPARGGNQLARVAIQRPHAGNQPAGQQVPAEDADAIQQAQQAREARYAQSWTDLRG